MFTKLAKVLGIAALAALVYVGYARQPGSATARGPVQIRYWDKWTEFEAEAMRKVVDRFNRSQERIHVDLLSISGVDEKLLLATAGGVPPDVVGLWSYNLSSFADEGALLPLDDYIKRAHITRRDYIPAYWDLCHYRGHMYALPTTPGSHALHWNKRLFREAGLDPERPPRTIQELDSYAQRLTKRDRSGRVLQAGFMPSEPGWWNWSWGYYFGGALWDGKSRITTDCPENIRAYQWARSYSKKYGVGSLALFRSGFGDFSSPQNAFMSGKVAMEIQGVWMGNYIHNYAPGMKWGAAPFPYPADRPELAQVACVETDTISIPAGAKHPKEAFEFIRFVQSQPAMELLCLGQRKHTPLARVSKEFLAKHPNPYIEVFFEVAKRPRPFSVPKTPIGMEYINEMGAAFDEIWLGRRSAADALARVRRRMQGKLDRHLEALARREGGARSSEAVKR
jgi:ABC-type glycerol-3-phosphate transport system substrate-binding protein